MVSVEETSSGAKKAGLGSAGLVWIISVGSGYSNFLESYISTQFEDFFLLFF